MIITFIIQTTLLALPTWSTRRSVCYTYSCMKHKAEPEPIHAVVVIQHWGWWLTCTPIQNSLKGYSGRLFTAMQRFCHSLHGLLYSSIPVIRAIQESMPRRSFADLTTNTNAPLSVEAWNAWGAHLCTWPFVTSQEPSLSVFSYSSLWLPRVLRTVGVMPRSSVRRTLYVRYTSVKLGYVSLAIRRQWTIVLFSSVMHGLPVHSYDILLVRHALACAIRVWRLCDCPSVTLVDCDQSHTGLVQHKVEIGHGIGRCLGLLRAEADEDCNIRWFQILLRKTCTWGVGKRRVLHFGGIQHLACQHLMSFLFSPLGKLAGKAINFADVFSLFF